jgi:hypothetical protein
MMETGDRSRWRLCLEIWESLAKENAIIRKKGESGDKGYWACRVTVKPYGTKSRLREWTDRIGKGRRIN